LRIALKDDLKTAVETELKAHEGDPNDRAKSKQQLIDLLGMKANGLVIVEESVSAFQNFAEAFENNAPDLHPWVAVYGATAGFWPFWARIAWTWLDTGKNHDESPTQERIAQLTKIYADLVSG
jgi:hypothetical protein